MLENIGVETWHIGLILLILLFVWGVIKSILEGDDIL